MTDFSQLRVLIDFLRASGVTSYTTPQLSLVLGEAPPPPLQESSSVDNPSKIGKSKPGLDGLTAEEQELLYGRKLDGE